MLHHIHNFFDLVAANSIEIYNEFSLQHELGLYIRNHIEGMKVQFERPVSFFGFPRADFIKKEIDISLFTTPSNPLSAVELKYPRAGQYPEQMFKTCQDIFFLEQLVSAGFSDGYFIMAADDPLFYRRETIDGIYAFFRGGLPISGQIFGPTGDKTRSVTIVQPYSVEWRRVTDSLQYFIIQVAREDDV